MPPRASLCGLLNIHKPEGWTSREVVNHVQKLVRPAKAGHAGTLDPLATGVLVVCVGPATRLINFVQASTKRYRGRFRLGLTSDTEDISGALTELPGAELVTRDSIESLLPGLTGQILQRPPAFSALHVDGQRAYELARKGKTVELDPRPVRIDRLILTEFSPPDFVLEITCGAGTYVRSVGRDLGAQLGCGAVMTALVREAVGSFAVSTAINPEHLDRDQLIANLIPARQAVDHLPTTTISDDEIVALRQGKSLSGQHIPTGPAGTMLALLNATGELVAVAELTAEGRCQPRIVLAT